MLRQEGELVRVLGIEPRGGGELAVRERRRLWGHLRYQWARGWSGRVFVDGVLVSLQDRRLLDPAPTIALRLLGRRDRRRLGCALQASVGHRSAGERWLWLAQLDRWLDPDRELLHRLRALLRPGDELLWVEQRDHRVLGWRHERSPVSRVFESLSPLAGTSARSGTESAP